MVWDQKLLLPSHKDRAAVSIFHRQMRFLQIISNMAESREASPMDHVFLLAGAPIPRQESVAAPNDFGIEIGGELGPIVR